MHFASEVRDRDCLWLFEAVSQESAERVFDVSFVRNHPNN